MGPEPKLRAVNVSHSFALPLGKAERTVIDDVSIDVNPGEFLCIVGASGCGKTTLLRILAGLVSPTGGQIRLDGRPLGAPSRQFGFVFQSDALIPWRTVEANVGLGLELRGADKRRRHEEAMRVLDLVKLEHWAKHFPRELSGGMRQRVNIARSLAISPTVIFMDEPFAALDAQTREIMQDELIDLCKRLNMTVVFVTHQIDEAVFLGDRVVVLESSPGRVREVVDVRGSGVGDPATARSDIKRSAEFRELVDHIWGLIAHDVQADIERELRGAGG